MIRRAVSTARRREQLPLDATVPTGTPNCVIQADFPLRRALFLAMSRLKPPPSRTSRKLALNGSASSFGCTRFQTRVIRVGELDLRAHVRRPLLCRTLARYSQPFGSHIQDVVLRCSFGPPARVRANRARA